MTFAEFVAAGDKLAGEYKSRAGVLQLTFGLSKAEAILLVTIEEFRLVISDIDVLVKSSDLDVMGRKRLAYDIYSEGICLRGFFTRHGFNDEARGVISEKLARIYARHMRLAPMANHVAYGLLVIERQFQYLMTGISDS